MANHTPVTERPHLPLARAAQADRYAKAALEQVLARARATEAKLATFGKKPEKTIARLVKESARVSD